MTPARLAEIIAAARDGECVQGSAEVNPMEKRADELRRYTK